MQRVPSFVVSDKYILKWLYFVAYDLTTSMDAINNTTWPTNITKSAYVSSHFQLILLLSDIKVEGKEKKNPLISHLIFHFNM